MIDTVIIVDDAADRGSDLLPACSSHFVEASWWRPKVIPQVEHPLDWEVTVNSKAELVDLIKSRDDSNVMWIWDIRLIFDIEFGEKERYDTDDYFFPRSPDGTVMQEETPLRQALLSRIRSGDCIILMSSYYNINSVLSDWTKDDDEGLIKSRVRGYSENFAGLSSTTNGDPETKTKAEWIAEGVDAALKLAGRAEKLDLRKDLWKTKYLAYFATGNDTIDHEFDKTEWCDFWSFLEEWWKLDGRPYPKLKTTVESSFKKYFHATMTIVETVVTLQSKFHVKA